ncbi:MAG: amino acid ABC transporter substrate-binding protein [Clostridia bacterium]|nr:amino acid ABC transporter substrate-binding protein [Clostridia bacterium]
MKKFGALLLTLALIALLLPAAQAEDPAIQAILDKGRLVLGLDDSFPPMGFQNDAGEIIGFDIDVAREVCNRLGVELALQPIDWAAKELELNDGNIDCIWNGMSITPERQASMSMTFAYLENAMEFYTKADAPLDAVQDLAGKKVAVQSGSYAEEMLDSAENAMLKESLAGVLAFDDYLTALMDLQAGGVDAVFIDRVVAEYKITGMGDTTIVGGIVLEDDSFGIGFRKADGALRDKVQSILIDMKKDGSLGEISTIWFGSDITTVPAQ